MVVLGNAASVLVATEYGFESRTLPTPTVPAYPPGRVHRLGDVAAALGLADAKFITHAVAVETSAYEELALDWVFHYYQLTCPVAARAAGARVATLVTWPDHGRFQSSLFSDCATSIDVCAKAFERTLRDHEQSSISDVGQLLFDRSDLAFSPTYPDTDRLVGSVAGVEYVGHVGWKTIEKDEPDWLLDWPRPGQLGLLLYAGVGDISIAQFVESANAAFGETEFDVVIAVGRAPTEHNMSQQSLSRNIRVEHVVPATSVLQRSNALVCHGGINTLMNAVKCGVPTLAFAERDPERLYFVERLEQLGIARNGRREHLTSGELAAAVRALVRECESAAEAFSATLPKLDGASAILDAMEGRQVEVPDRRVVP